MSRYKLNLQPGGIIPRDITMQIPMADKPEAAIEAEAAAPVVPLLHIATGYPAWGENRYSWVHVTTDDIQAADLLVTLTVSNDDVLDFIPAGSSATETSGIIHAGSQQVRFLTHYQYTTPASAIMTASAPGYDDVTETVSVACAHNVTGVHYSCLSMGASSSTRQLSITTGPASMTIANHEGAVIQGYLDLNDRCFDDIITWEVTGTGGAASGLDVQFVAGIPLEINVFAPGSLLGGSAYSPGDTIRIKSKLNGAVVSTLLADYLFTFA